MTPDQAMAFYTSQGITHGSLQDREMQWLKSQLGGSPVGSIDDLWNQLLTVWGVPPGSIQDRRTGLSFLCFPGTAGNYASTPDSPALSITGDIDIRVKWALDDWDTPLAVGLLNKLGGAQTAGYRLLAIPTGALRFDWGTGAGLANTTSIAHGISDGTAKWVRVTFRPDNGASQREVAFYLSDDGISWTQLGTTSVGTATTMADSDAPLELGKRDATTMTTGKCYYAEVRNGIDGTIVACFNPADAESGNTSIVSSTTGETWTISTSGIPAAHLVKL